MKLDTKHGALILVGVFALAVIVISAVLRGGRQGEGRPSGTAVSPTPSYAPQGELVAGFPNELILDNAALVTNSYSIKYSSSLNQYTAQWNSALSMQALYTTYKNYLSKNSWTITNDAASRSTSRALGAAKGSNKVSVVIISQGKGSQVIISYVAK